MSEIVMVENRHDERIMFFETPSFIVSPYLFISVILLNIGLLSVLILWGTQFFKRIFQSREQARLRLERAERAAEAILNQAREESLAIIGKAHQASANILKESAVSREGFQKEFEKVVREFSRGETERLLKLSEGFSKSYQASTDEARKTYLKNMDALYQHLTDRARESTERFEKFMQDEVAQFEGIAKFQFERLQSSVVTEVESYKQDLIKRVERSIFRIIYLVSTNVLGKTIDLEGHRELVIKALEEAKREGFFE
ncbi:MAG: hypothetical protein UX07_C0003G0008 [Parcubacteria group bacterium GW2011_GWA2_45_30]|nr:MAG: hypothetical protein UX07_C0003G0008 [Parcubacteria group bacterium GW2011_GWA2_45_30]